MSNNLSDKTLRIFVSSVGKMMDEERRTLRELIWKSGHIPIAMEGFSGNHDQTSIDIVKDNLDHADVVIFVLGFTYGSIIGESLLCKDCPVKGSCNAKRRSGNCTISYTNFEYLYAKQKKVLPYCIIQKNIRDVTAFRKRLDAFIQKNIEDHDAENVSNALLSEYFSEKDMYEKLLSKAMKNWVFSYDANDLANISNSITNAFSAIQKQLVKDGENLSGLIDGNQVKKELIEKNRQIEKLQRNVDQYQSIQDMLVELKQTQCSPLPSTAVTGTCIPFQYNKDDNMITTYLVCNSAYSGGSRIMFPGGHAFVNDDSPETVAIMKAKIETGLDVRPIDLYSSFNNPDSEFSSHFTIYRPPHFTYLFEEDGSAKCYKEKNHLKHYDLAYVCEIYDIHPAMECTQVRIVVKLPNTPLTLFQVKEIIEESVMQYNLQNQTEIMEKESFEDYIAKMLTDAHTDYIKYLQQLEI